MEVRTMYAAIDFYNISKTVYTYITHTLRVPLVMLNCLPFQSNWFHPRFSVGLCYSIV